MPEDLTRTPREAIARAEAVARSERWSDALEAYADAVRIARGKDSESAACADALRGAAAIRIRMGEWQEATRDLAESRLVAERIGDDRRVALAENARGVLEFERGAWTEAARRYTAARTHAGAIEDVSLLMRIENNEGALWSAQGDRERAEDHFRRALRYFRDTGQDPCGARVMNNLGMLLTERGEEDEPESLFDKALEDCKRHGDLALGATVMINRARLALKRDDPMRAHALATTAAAFAERLGNGPMGADAVCLLGAVARSEGRHFESERYLDEALRRSAAGQAPLAEAETWEEIGQLRLDMGREDEAVEALRQARRCWLALGAEKEAERLERTLRASAVAR